MIPSQNKMMESDMEDFICALAQRAGEGYTVHEIYEWLNYLNGEYDHIAQAMQLRNDPQDGIKTVTTRADTRPDRGMEE
jgi:hypothetical protein